jgi:hypothetical protein
VGTSCGEFHPSSNRGTKAFGQLRRQAVDAKCDCYDFRYLTKPDFGQRDMILSGVEVKNYDIRMQFCSLQSFRASSMLH